MKVVDEALGEEITVQGEHLKGKKKIQGKPFNKSTFKIICRKEALMKEI